MSTASVTQEQLARILHPEQFDVEETRVWLGMTQGELADAVGRSTRTITRWKAEGERPTRASAELGRSLRKVGRIKFLLEDLIGHEQALTWLRTPNAGFRGEAPVDLITSGRMDEVIAVLEALADGGGY